MKAMAAPAVFAFTLTGCGISLFIVAAPQGHAFK